MKLNKIETFIKEKMIKTIVVHGLYSSTHTHRFIHEAIYGAFEYIIDKLNIDIDLYWCDDDEFSYNLYNLDTNYLIFTSPHYDTDNYLPIVNNIFYILHYRTHNKITNTLVNKYNTLLEKKQAVKYVEYRGGPNACFNKMFAQYIDNKRLFWYYYYIPDKNDVYDLDNVEKVNYTYKIQPTNEVHMAWATNILPEAIDQNILLIKQGIQLIKGTYFCGTIWHTNEKEISEWKTTCIQNRINYVFDRETNENEHQKKIRSALIAPAIQGASQNESKDWFYIPCRIIKNISYGALGVTNNEGVYNMFKDYLIIYDRNIEKLFLQTLDYRKYAEKNQEEYIKKMVNVMEFVRDHHTYLNRIDALIQFGFY